jgi:hypothetical protein
VESLQGHLSSNKEYMSDIMKNFINQLFVTPALLALFTFNLLPAIAHAQGTAFIYQGHLLDNGQPASGIYDLRFAIYDSTTNGNLIAEPMTNTAVGVSNGLFAVSLDFGNVFNGNPRWLEIGVHTNGGGVFTTMIPRQPLLPTPYAITAGSASNLLGNLPAAQLSGTIPGSTLPTNPAFSGAVSAARFSGDGSDLTNLNAATLNGQTAANFWQMGGNNVVPGQFLGSTNNQPVEIWVNGLRALRLESDPSGQGGPNVVGGSPGNYVSNTIVGATIGGGGMTNYWGASLSNIVTANLGTVGGGAGNTASGDGGIVAGGQYNTASGICAFVGGGGWDGISAAGNMASGNTSVVGGGLSNTAEGANAVVAGGSYNTASSYGSTAGGGIENGASGDFSTVAGGRDNIASGEAATVAGGEENVASNDWATVSGGTHNTASDVEDTVSGGSGNTASGGSSSIGGGFGNSALGPGSTVGGGNDNKVVTAYATVSGGDGNKVSGSFSTIGGGEQNTVTGEWATVSGGWNNSASGAGAFVGGGGYDGFTSWWSNERSPGNQATGAASVVSGGIFNLATGPHSAVGGGFTNTASGPAAVVGGGTNNMSSSYASTVPGGANNTAAGNCSFAAGDDAQATNDYSFVWSDGSTSTVSTTTNQFVARASGGFVFYTSATNTGVILPSGSGSWSSMSDRNAKNDFASVHLETLLAKVASLPVTTWSYKTEPGVRHIGPMAQDFFSTFKVGEDDKHIADVDEGGVALAAIKGLNQKVDSENAALRAQNTHLQQQVGRLQSIVAQLYNKLNGSEYAMTKKQ